MRKKTMYFQYVIQFYDLNTIGWNAPYLDKIYQSDIYCVY